MARSIVVDGRMLHYNSTGIGRYVRHLYRAIAAAIRPAFGGPSERAITVLYHGRDRQRVLRPVLPRGATVWTPAHHRWERWTLALEGTRLRPALWHAPDHVSPQPAGWRTVVTVHDLAFWRYPDTHAPDSRAYYAGLWRSVAQATRVICVSQATKGELLAATGVAPGKVRVVHEAPDPCYGAAGFPWPENLPSDVEVGRPPAGTSPAGRPYFVWVGTIQPRKGLAGAFRALAQLPPSRRPELRLVGALGWNGAEIMSLPHRLGISGDVRSLGRLPTSEVDAQYRGALALVYPSLCEGFGLPVLEAMAAGAPVIAADRASIPEVAGSAAILIDPEDTDALAAAMSQVAEDAALRAALRQRGRARAQEFTWERAARETLDIFEEALRE